VHKVKRILFVAPLIAGLSIGSAACGRTDNSGAIKALVAQAWSPRVQDCAVEFVRFSHTRIELQPKGRASSELVVTSILNNPEYPDDVMVVVDAGNSMAESSRLAMVFDVSGERLKLVGEGSPTHLHPVEPGSPNAIAFNLVRCPAD
jgi:hypothetical protein